VIFGPIFQISTDDPVLRSACYRVYNDWLLDFCKAAPDRLIGLPMLPETPAAALAELERVVAKGGVRQVNLMIANVAPKLDDPAWEPLWHALEASGVILSWHITVFVGKPGDRAAGKRLREHQVLPRELPRAVRRPLRLGHPRAAPGTAHRDGRGGHGMAPLARPGARLSPLEALGGEGVLGRQGRERARDEAERSLSVLRRGSPLVGSDYPHPDSVWPNSRAAIERQMSHLSPEMRRKLTHDNAAALYGPRGT
jgi:hypothetical protein